MALPGYAEELQFYQICAFGVAKIEQWPAKDGLRIKTF
jgi:hypothetical protein